MTDAILVKRMARNLQYKLTYLEIFEAYKEPNPGSEMAELLESLIEGQRSAIGPLSSFLRGLGVNTHDLELNEKLLEHAASRNGVESRLRFIHDGLDRAVSWYRTQLMDRQMSGTPVLQKLLLDLGEIDAGKLWRTEAVMSVLRVAVQSDARETEEPPEIEPAEGQTWRPRLAEDVHRPAWDAGRAGRWPKASRFRRRE